MWDVVERQIGSTNVQLTNAAQMVLFCVNMEQKLVESMTQRTEAVKEQREELLSIWVVFLIKCSASSQTKFCELELSKTLWTNKLLLYLFETDCSHFVGVCLINCRFGLYASLKQIM